MTLGVVDLRCEYQKNPLGIDVVNPRISWRLRSPERHVLQTTYELEVAGDQEFRDVLWSSGKVESDASVHVEVSGMTSVSCKRYFYRVKVWDSNGHGSDWSETAFWETGLLHQEDWTAQWISAPEAALNDHPEQVPMLRREFTISDRLKQARIYATSLGIYELELNGERVGDQYFTPGWTSYKNRLQVQTYDVTDMLQTGDNALGAMIGKGWFRGNLGWKDQQDIYGDRCALLLQLHVTYEDGTTEVIASDSAWSAQGSPIIMSEIYHGETYDARLERPGWSTSPYDAADWLPVETIEHSLDILVAQENEPVRKFEQIRPVEFIRTPKGETVLDFGQNMVGWVRFNVQGEAGREVKIHHAEVLDREGNFYTDNLRSAKATVRYTLKGQGVESFEPRFTFFGFRYIRLVGFPEPIRPEDFTGIVLHSDMEQTGTFACSDPLINQLQHNIEWGLKGNFLDVPTDCPQRDERLGWTGDAQMFIRTAVYLRNAAPFFTKWLRDLKADQRADGGVPHVIPDVIRGEAHSSAAWADAAVIIPWTMYVAYGDQRILEEQYESMAAWIAYVRAQGDHEYLWNTGQHFGDWLGLDSKPDTNTGATDKDYIATAFYAYSTSLMQKTASVLGKHDDAQAYAELYERIVAAYTEEFVTPAGRLSVPTQTAQVLGLMFGLLEGRAKERAIAKLMELLEENEIHLTTGFVGTPYLNHVLSENGQLETAYRLLFQKDYPSWLYQVTKGATTIWEHWDGIKEDGSFWSDKMNSFNHYAYGAIGDWLYRCVVGIDTDAEQVGYKRIHIRPRPDQRDGDENGTLTWAEGRFASMYGEIRSRWERKGDAMELQVTIPANTTAEIVLPEANLSRVQENGVALDQQELLPGIVSVTQTEEDVVIEAGSGEYRFTW